MSPNNDKLVESCHLGYGKISYTYDTLGRVTGTVTWDNAYKEDFLYSYITYRQLDENTTTTQISRYTVGGKDYDYTYDGNGNILTITVDDTLCESYTYDALNQLIRENSVTQNKTIVYTYDNGGNILSKTEYPYTLGEPAQATNTVNYTYGDTNWKDKMTGYNGTAITYDDIGNPLSYRNGISLTWKNGRRLASFSNTQYNITYKYNDSGQRTSKTINGAETKSFVTGEGVLQERRPNGDILTYMRDLSGSVVAFEYYSAEDNLISFYYLLRNLQGDVIAITDREGNKLVEYTYDAWGKVLSITGSQANTIGQLNPYRYRGYYYDVETGFYYLQSRYYDPETRRFLNADGYVSTGQGVLGYNMFAYCGNNPVNRADPTGQSWEELWRYAETLITEIGKAIGTMSPAYAGCGGAALSDGVLPFGDLVGLAGAALITVGAIGIGVYNTAQAPSISIPKIKEKTTDKAIPKKPDSPVYFPVDPNNFNPVGLVKVHRTGTKNGSFISWMDPNMKTEVFRWDENPNYPNGSHYHIYGTGHYYPGTTVPEPYATIYFPLR